MKYGIICAMQEEINLLYKDIEVKNKYNIASRDFFEGTLYGKDVILVKSLIGKVASALTATILINNFKPDCIIFCGTAGGIDTALNTGDIVIGDKLVQHDFYDGVQNFVIPIINIDYFNSDKSLSDKITDAVNEYVNNDMHSDIPQEYLDRFGIKSPKSVTGTIASGDQFINNEDKHNWIKNNVKNIKCAEMEGAAVAQVCYEFNTPFAVLRVISDMANDNSNFDFESFVTEAASHITRGAIRSFLKKA